MKHKHLITLLTASATICAVGALSACRHAHTYGDWTEISPANCTEDGVKTRTCTACGETSTESIPAKGHTYAEIVFTQQVTCTQNGTGTQTCTVCKTSKSVTLPATGHAWGEYQTNAVAHWRECKNGCEESGKLESHSYGNDNTCTVCKAKMQATEGLEYVLTEDGSGYAVRIGTATEAETLVIPEEADDGVNGKKPVTTIEDYETNNFSSGVFKSLYVPSSVTTVDTYAFWGCSTLETAVIDGTISGTYAFYKCAALETAVVNGTFEEGTFQQCGVLKTVIVGNGVTQIPDSAFYKCTALESVTIPDSVTSVVQYAFGECASLTSFTAEGLQTIGNYAFYKCTALSSFAAEGLQTIGNSAFYKCESLEAFSFSEGMTIGKTAFDSSGLKSASLPNGVTIGENAFRYSAIASLTVNLEVVPQNAFYGLQSLTELKLNGVKEIGDNAFDNCILLESLILPDSVTKIGLNSFSSCYKLMHVTLGKNVTSIGEGAFGFCRALLDVKNLSSISVTPLTSETQNGNIGAYAINVYGETGKTAIHETNGFTMFDNGETVYLMGYRGDKEELTLPRLEAEKTYDIYQYAFKGNTKIRKVTLSSSVRDIKYNAFEGCTALAEIDLAGAKAIEHSAFLNCSALTSVKIPEGITEIGYSAFENCSALASVTLPATLKKIGFNAFMSCSALTSITIPAEVTQIYWNAFRLCNALTSVTFENPNGWKVQKQGGGFGDIFDTPAQWQNVSGLSDAATAATYLKTTYAYYEWKRT